MNKSSLTARGRGLIATSVNRAYVAVFGRPSAQWFNDRLLHLAMRGRGYNNGPDMNRTGEARFLRLLASTNPKLCIDVGANEGKYSALLLEFTAAEVIAFEPLPRSFERLEVLENRYPGRFTRVNSGVGASDGTLDLHYGEDTALASFSSEVSQIELVAATNINTLAVPVVALDSYLAKRIPQVSEIDLIKIDTEGFEYEVLAGAKETITKLRPKFIQMEFNLHQLFRAHTINDFASMLPGYLTFQILPKGTCLVRRDTSTSETNIFEFSNFVFVREDLVANGVLSQISSLAAKR